MSNNIISINASNGRVILLYDMKAVKYCCILVRKAGSNTGREMSSPAVKYLTDMMV